MRPLTLGSLTLLTSLSLSCGLPGEKYQTEADVQEECASGQTLTQPQK